MTTSGIRGALNFLDRPLARIRLKHLMRVATRAAAQCSVCRGEVGGGQCPDWWCLRSILPANLIHRAFGGPEPQPKIRTIDPGVVADGAILLPSAVVTKFRGYRDDYLKTRPATLTLLGQLSRRRAQSKDCKAHRLGRCRTLPTSHPDCPSPIDCGSL